MPEEKKRLWPGDIGYEGGIHHTTVTIDGKRHDVRTVKDSKGNPVSVTITKKWWIF